MIQNNLAHFYVATENPLEMQFQHILQICAALHRVVKHQELYVTNIVAMNLLCCKGMSES